MLRLLPALVLIVTTACTTPAPGAGSFGSACAAAGTDLSYAEGITATVATAEIVPAAGEVPEHCRVTGTIDPSVRFTLKLPLAAAWNQRFAVIGCASTCGYEQGEECDPGVLSGVATATSDAGHRATDDLFRWAVEQPGTFDDWAFRSTHVTAVVAKALTEQVYARPIGHSYFTGCSNGGRQGLIQAQRYPADFDGIQVDSPALDALGHAAASWPWTVGAAFTPDGAARLTRETVDAVSRTVMAQCDGRDGIADGLVADPLSCTPDLGAAGLTPDQRDIAERLYAAPTNSAGPILPRGLLPGSESVEWAEQFATDRSFVAESARSAIRYALYGPPLGAEAQVADWSPEDVPARVAGYRAAADATANLDAFRARGGKLLVTVPLGDTVVSPIATLSWMDRVQAHHPDADDFVRLFALPGIGHCWGGHYGATPQTIQQLVSWVEQGTAPDTVDLWFGDRRVPTFPYPRTTVYREGSYVPSA
ncbi:tannase/feruloyl esterase family alpha/beta hydrolase [Pseudonocardia oroxyli]|uniref:tannase/feruloyl esterase family alpha/beta hydrolase n=1 Tax=Pseudonocardia oroxyli TaxID=366584 RepID=UPI0015A46241|nr:tannase/feruloyl esterase family alpha/beta hydrolase [Pseudonocardia oroxyli]